MIRGAAIALAALCAVAAGSVSACRLALVLALDVSSSVDADEDRLQRLGLAAALLDPEVQQAFLGGGDPVAVAIYEWSGRYNQITIQPWRLIRSEADLLIVSNRIASSRRAHDDFPTAVGYALGHAASILRDGPDCLFQTIDLSGDGINNEGFGPDEAYAHFPLAGVTVNGLVIDADDYEDPDRLIGFYMDEVRQGPGSFVEVANGFEDFERAMRRKLLRELQSQMIGARPVGAGDGAG